MTRLVFGGIFYYRFVRSLLLCLSVKKLVKNSVTIVHISGQLTFLASSILQVGQRLHTASRMLDIRLSNLYSWLCVTPHDIHFT